MDLKFWLLKNIPCGWRLARYSSETAGSLTKKSYSCCCRPFVDVGKPKKIESDHFWEKFWRKL